MKKLPILIFAAILVFSIVFPVFAQEEQEQEATGSSDASMGVANYLVIEGDVRPGNIICSASNGYSLCDEAYDSSMLGVVAENPAVSFNLTGSDESSHPVISSGTTYVLVNSEGGEIKKGDLITTSATNGVGTKASKSGFVLGSAIEGFNPGKPTDSGTIAVSLYMHYSNLQSAKVQGQLQDVFKLSAIAATESPSEVFKYFLAGLVIMSSVAAGLYTFGRTASRGLEALGRNPMAQRIIQMGIAMNVVLTVAIVSAGVVIAYFILRL
ncbi:hypothetical protein HYW42_03400 [Candidatus Daviesbacteria bacterium]|nr:hypothetical protein [Candidatus Daviesbacteria bacterium]